MPDWSFIVAALRDAGVGIREQCEARPVGGGDISAAWRVETDAAPVFVKTGPASSHEMFSAEAEGLSELGAPGVIRVPAVLACDVEGGTAFVAMEWIDTERTSRAVETRLGEQLAALHETTQDRYGWHRDNTIGLTPQINTPGDDWVAFYREHRLGYQLRLAADRGYSLGESADQLMHRLPVFFDEYRPAASLLHGDLWGGNWACSAGEPVIFDPAVYYGDRETDLAMTRLFGGFGSAFYEAYEANAPLAPGHRARCDLYQLYHVLNHLNLFGTGYLGRAQTLIRRLLQES